jgi:hypothetical protein
MICGLRGQSAKRVTETSARVVTTVVATTVMAVDSLGELRHLATESMPSRCKCEDGVLSMTVSLKSVTTSTLFGNLMGFRLRRPLDHINHT